MDTKSKPSGTDSNKMKFTLTAITALVAPIVAQSTTPAPTSTDPWYGSGPPWASSDPAKWSSIYQSLLSEGKIPSTLTAAPWPTGSYGPGQGPWGPGGPHGPGGPGGPGHWGGNTLVNLNLRSIANPMSRSRRPRPVGLLKLGTIQRLVHAFRLAQRPLDGMVGRQRMPPIRLARLDSWTLE